MGFDIKRGGIVEFEDGHQVEVLPDAERVWGELWHNGAFIEVMCHSEPRCPEPSDRIHLQITDGGGNRKDWLMNVEDAMAIVQGLTMAVRQAIMEDWPLKPAQSEGE
jgi:hypothetical protein